MPNRVLKVGVQDDLIVVMERRTLFYAVFAKVADSPHVVLLRRRPASDSELVAKARGLAVAKAIEIGWIEGPDAPAHVKRSKPKQRGGRKPAHGGRRLQASSHGL